MAALDETFPVTLGTDMLPAGVSAGDIPPATITITSDDGPPPAGVTVAPRSLTVAEGGAATYTVVLNSQPTGNVIIDVDARPQRRRRPADAGAAWLRRRGRGFEAGAASPSPAQCVPIGYAGSCLLTCSAGALLSVFPDRSLVSSDRAPRPSLFTARIVFVARLDLLVRQSRSMSFPARSVLHLMSVRDLVPA